MNELAKDQRPAPWFGFFALAALAMLLSPLNVRIVIAQDVTEIVVLAADPGEPPAPKIVPQESLPAAKVVEPISQTSSSQTSSETSQTNSEVTSGVASEATSEITSETELSELTANSSPVADAQAAAKPAVPEQTQTPESVRTLSVEPGIKPILPDDRPAWVGASSDFSSAQHYLYIGSLPTVEENEADEALDEPLLAAVRNYIDQEVVNEQGASTQMPVDVDYIRKNLIDEPRGYLCELSTSQGAMFQKWVTVRVTPEQRELFKQWHVEAEQRTRLAPLGIILVSGLILVSLFHLGLRRFHGSPALPSVQAVTEQVKPTRRSKFGMLSKAMIFLGFLLLPAVLLLTVISSTKVQVQQDEFHEIMHSNLHNSSVVETLDGNDVRIFEHKSN